jgi:hypothetical protein
MIMGIVAATSWLKNAAWTAPSTNSLADIFSAWSHQKAARHQGAGQAPGPGSGPASGAASLGAGAAGGTAAQAQSGLLQVQGAGASLATSLNQAAINQAHAAYRAHASVFSQAAQK